MRIEMLVAVPGTSFAFAVGDVCEVPDSEAIRLISARYAIPAPDGVIEQAVQRPITEKRSRKPR